MQSASSLIVSVTFSSEVPDETTLKVFVTGSVTEEAVSTTVVKDGLVIVIVSPSRRPVA